MPVQKEKQEIGGGVSLIIAGVSIFLVIALVYVWFHVNITKLNYRIAEEIQMRDSLKRGITAVENGIRNSQVTTSD